MKVIKTKKYIADKGCLTSGILYISGEINDSGYFFANPPFSLLTKDFFDTEDEALSQAEKVRQKKIASLKKQLDKVEKMKIKIKYIAEKE